MNKNGTHVPRLCFFDGIARNQSSVSPVVASSVSAVIVILSPVAATGNALVLAAIWNNPSLRTTPYILLCCLAFTDLCTGLFTQPFYVATELMCLQESQKIQDRLSLHRFVKVVSEGCGTYFNCMTVFLITLMSVERWLYMARRSLVIKRVAYLIVAIVLVCPIPIAVLRTFQVLHGVYELALNTFSFNVLFLCFLTTSIAYFKVFRIINQHQQQVQANVTSQNLAQPAINLAKYKKSVFSILLIVALFYISYLPFLVFVGLHLSRRNHSEVALAFSFSVMFMFLSSSLNPVLYVWRMSDIRNGVRQLLKQLLCRQN